MCIIEKSTDKPSLMNISDVVMHVQASSLHVPRLLVKACQHYLDSIHNLSSRACQHALSPKSSASDDYKHNNFETDEIETNADSVV